MTVSPTRPKLQERQNGVDGRVLNVPSEASVRELFEELGVFDHLVYTAGEPLSLQEVDSLGLEQARTFFEVRYSGAVSAVKHASSRISQGGSIVLSSGSAGARPQKCWTVAAKICGAIEALPRALAVELARVRVNAVALGVVRTEMRDEIPLDEREAFCDDVGNAMLCGRVGEPDDVAQTRLDPMRDRFTTGAVVPVDGGARPI